MRPPPPEELVTKFVEKMHERIPDMTDHRMIAMWVIDYASAAFSDGYKRGTDFATMEFVNAMVMPTNPELAKEILDAAGVSPEFQQRDAGVRRGASGGSAEPSFDGGSGVPAGKGVEAGAGARAEREAPSDSIRPTRKGNHPTGSGD